MGGVIVAGAVTSKAIEMGGIGVMRPVRHASTGIPAGDRDADNDRHSAQPCLGSVGSDGKRIDLAGATLSGKAGHLAVPPSIKATRREPGHVIGRFLACQHIRHDLTQHRGELETVPGKRYREDIWMPGKRA